MIGTQTRVLGDSASEFRKHQHRHIISAAYTIASKDAPSHRTSQIFAMAENLAIYRDGWVAATVPKLTPWEPKPPRPVPLAERKWQLFDVAADYGEQTDLAAQHPEVVQQLAAAYDTWWTECQPLLVNEKAVGPKLNPFAELYWQQFGGGPTEADYKRMDPTLPYPPAGEGKKKPKAK